MNYIEAITLGFPNVQVHSFGDPYDYSTLVVDNDTTLPTKTELDAFIASYVPSQGPPALLTKYEFRKLFTFEERIAVDNAPSNMSLPENVRMAFVTILNDLNAAEGIDLTNSDVIASVQLTEQVGLIGAGRAAQVLAGIRPT
jgi:hypothetical protein